MPQWCYLVVCMEHIILPQFLFSPKDSYIHVYIKKIIAQPIAGQYKNAKKIMLLIQIHRPDRASALSDYKD